MQYRVIWEIDEEEASPEAAARAAWRHMRRPDSTANVFVVIDEEGAATRLELQEIGLDPTVVSPSAIWARMAAKPAETLGCRET